MSDTTRRGMLKSGLELLAGAVGLGAAGPASALSALPDTTLRLFATGLSTRAHGRPYGRPAKPDDRISSHGQLIDGPGSDPIGTFAATGVAIRSPFGDGPSTIEQHVFTLHDGTITGSGHADAGIGTFAVTGGTGRYTGARGSYAAVLSPYGLGGDGTARFDFTLRT